ncbi:MAG: type 4a pilus biogenesis protein PilO [Planctomycetes bacterium]|nr:type 4a pilus biogenesis protein PilO [Planctomycetota bacterium]
MGSKNRRNVMILGLAAAAFVGGLVYLFLQIKEAGDFWPYNNEPGTLTHEVNQLTDEVQRLQVEVARIGPAREQLEAIRIEHELASTVLPRESSPDQLVAAIRIKAQQAGVIPDRLIPSAARAPQQPRGGGARRAGGAFEEWNFSLTIRGTYDQIASFVNRMEEFESVDAEKTGTEKRFFQVQDIEITAEENGLANLGAAAASGPEGRKGHQCILLMQTYRFTGSE